MKIRRHSSADFPAIAELRWQLKKDDALAPDDPSKGPFLARYLQHLEEPDREGRTVHWLLEEDGTIVGVMTLRVVQKEPSPVKECDTWGYLTNAFVVPARRNRGYGTRLLEAIKAWALEQDLELLIVWPSEASYRFYRRAGFTGRDDPLELIIDAGESAGPR